MSSQRPIEHPPEYPAQWEADVLLSDGGVAHLRPIRPEDADLLIDFYARVSPESKYLRFFAPYPELTPRDVQRFTVVDHVDRVALIMTIGDRMVAVGRYDRVRDRDAEVAFLVEDSMQGRGVGPLLLEHLAEAARERGITRFTADVLPQNRAMVGVFAEAGYRVSRQLEDGVVQVDFPILPTDTSMGVMERREHRAEANSIRRLLTPEQVVLLAPDAQLRRLQVSLTAAGYTGRVVALDSADRIGLDGLDAEHDPIDLVVADVAETELGTVVIDAAHHGAKGLVVLGDAAGTAAAPGATLVSLARAYGLRALGPDALGPFNSDPAIALNLSPAPTLRPGRVGIFCQAAAIGVMLLSAAVEDNVGLSTFISTGAYADVSGNDVMQFWEDDERTAVCLMSLDTLGNPRKFNRIARRLTRRKPVVVFAPSRSLRTFSAADHHDRVLAPAEAIDSLFRQSGVIVTDRRAAMYDVAKVLARQPLPKGPRVRVIASAATLARQVAAAAVRIGLVADDPVVLTGAAAVQQVRASMEDPEIDSVLCVLVEADEETVHRAHAQLEECAQNSVKPVLGVFIDFTSVDHRAVGSDGTGQLPAFDSYGDALAALNAVTAYAHWRARDPGAVPDREVDLETARGIVHRALVSDPQGRWLTDDEVAELLRSQGIRAVPRYRVESLAEAVAEADRLGWDVVLKATSRAVRGRPDLASVHRHLDTPDELAEAWRELGLLVAELGVGGPDDQALAEPVVQAMMPTGVSVTVRSIEDPDFGPVISLGLAGLASEMLGDIVHRVPPLTDVDAAAMVRSLRAAPLLFGVNGATGVDVDAVEDLLCRVAVLADELPQLAEVMLTPCLVTTDGVAVLGARMRVLPTAGTRDPLARSL